MKRGFIGMLEYGFVAKVLKLIDFPNLREHLMLNAFVFDSIYRNCGNIQRRGGLGCHLIPCTMNSG